MENKTASMWPYNEFAKVYKTYDLSIFKTLDGNRVPNLQHINRLSYSIGKNGMICNPIIVNEKMEVIDGQHRLEAAKIQKTFVYFIQISGYALQHVHTLNLNQKNWGKSDYLNGYADMGIESYVKLRDFTLKNKEFSISNCIALCSNTSHGTGSYLSAKLLTEKKECIFEEGTWIGKDFELAQAWVDKMRVIGTIYDGYNRTIFVRAFAIIIKSKAFNFNEFMHKLRMQPTALVDCVNTVQYTQVIEDIYNYKSRNKVNLRY
jgi:hypothetical protein